MPHGPALVLDGVGPALDRLGIVLETEGTVMPFQRRTGCLDVAADPDGAAMQ